MMKNTHAWNSQTKYPNNDEFNDKKSEIELSSQLESSQIQPSDPPKTPVSPFSEELPLPDFDLETPTPKTLKESGFEENARSTEFEIFRPSNNPHKTPDSSSGFGEFLASQKRNICPPTPPEEFKNTPNALRQTRLYHVMTQVKRKEFNEDEGGDEGTIKKCNFQGDSVLYESYEEFLEKKPRYKAGNGLNKRIRKSLHFKFV